MQKCYLIKLINVFYLLKTTLININKPTEQISPRVQVFLYFIESQKIWSRVKIRFAIRQCGDFLVSKVDKFEKSLLKIL